MPHHTSQEKLVSSTNNITWILFHYKQLLWVLWIVNLNVVSISRMCSYCYTSFQFFYLFLNFWKSYQSYTTTELRSDHSGCKVRLTVKVRVIRYDNPTVFPFKTLVFCLKYIEKFTHQNLYLISCESEVIERHAFQNAFIYLYRQIRSSSLLLYNLFNK